MVKKNNKSLIGNMLNTGIGTMVGVGLIGGTSEMVNQLPAGTAKSITGIVPGLQATSLVAHNVKFVKDSFGKSSNLVVKKSKGNKKLW